MSNTLRTIVLASTFAAAAVLASPALADSAFLDPDGLTVWQQIIAWLAGDLGTTVDPNG